MPTINERLICCQCGADIGDANDPYRDPNCLACLHAELEQEDEPEPEGRNCFGAYESEPRAAGFHY